MISKLDYRCRAIGCTQGNHCRRFLTGDAAKNSAVPFAAFDTRRDTVACDGFLPRMMAPIAIETEGGGHSSAELGGFGPQKDMDVLDERIKKAMHILRNPFGWDTEERRRAAHDACNAIDGLAAAYENIRQFAEANGLDTTCHMPHNAELNGARRASDLSAELGAGD